MATCFYCGKKIAEGSGIKIARKNDKHCYCCSDTCKENAFQFLHARRRYFKISIVLMLVAVGLMISQIFNPTSYNTSLGLLLLGVTFFFFPHGRGGFWGRIGVKNALIVMRTLAVLAFLCGIALFFI